MKNFNNFGFIRVVAAVPKVKVADADFNAEQSVSLILEADKIGAHLIVFPECNLTGYTANDLFHQKILQRAAVAALKKICAETKNCVTIAVVGLPLAIDNQLFNCAAIIQSGKILGIVPKTFIPGYKEYYEQRWFAPGTRMVSDSIIIDKKEIPCGIDLLFQSKELPDFMFGIEICEDLWVPIPPSSAQALAGATVLLNLSASNELVAKSEYRKNLVRQQSGRCVAAYIMASAGTGESTTDMVFSGDAMIAENGIILAENKRFQRFSNSIVSDIDVCRLALDRQRTTTFGESKEEIALDERVIQFSSIQKNWKAPLQRKISENPFVPQNLEKRNSRCEEIFSIQTAGLAKRLEHCNCKKVVIGLSGGLDSTLALLVCVKTFELLGLDKKNIKAITMPGFGTSNRTYQNAKTISETLEISLEEIDIKPVCEQHFKDINHNPENHDIVFENVQARARTFVLMNKANQQNGLVIGTGDLSELALGWCTYNGDHISMYNVNCGIPKTLVKYLIQWVTDTQMNESAKEVLKDILDTPISPELLPLDKTGNINQKTEDVVGPYELHDFFLYHIVRFGATPSKVLFLAEQAFEEKKYSSKEIKKWLKVFIKRFFDQQFKRSCVPDGPKVGSVSLSPRGDWRMPSDASPESWLKEL